MMIDELFQKPTDQFADPHLRDWDARLSRPESMAKVEVEWPSIVFGQTFPEMSIHISENGEPQPLETLSWDDELNAVLVARAVRALDETQEATRFTLALRAAFKRAEREFGDGYFNSVFFAVLRKLDLAEHLLLRPLIQELDYIFNLEKHNQPERYQRCFDIIESAIRSRAHELKDSLGYSLDESKKILVDALVNYIDRRFSVSIRKQRGLL